MKPAFISGKIYHVYNRGVEKRKIFLSDNDKLRFLHSMFVFNDQSPVVPSNLRRCLEVEPPNLKEKNIIGKNIGLLFNEKSFSPFVNAKERQRNNKIYAEIGNGLHNVF